MLQLAPHLVYPHDFKNAEVLWISSMIHLRSERILMTINCQCYRSMITSHLLDRPSLPLRPLSMLHEDDIECLPRRKTQSMQLSSKTLAWNSGKSITLHCSYSTRTGLLPGDRHLHFPHLPAFLSSQLVSARLR